MNFKKYILDFKKISGLIAVAIVKNIECPEMFTSIDISEEFKNMIENLCYFMNKKILDLTIKNFSFKKANWIIVAYYQQNILVIIQFSEEINLHILTDKVNEFFNDLLING